MAKDTKTNKPVAQFHAGSCGASVFLNESDDKEWYSIIISRVYNAGTEKKPELKNTNTFNQNDFSNLEYVVRKAKDYCIENKIKYKE